MGHSCGSFEEKKSRGELRTMENLLKNFKRKDCLEQGCGNSYDILAKNLFSLFLTPENLTLNLNVVN